MLWEEVRVPITTIQLISFFTLDVFYLYVSIHPVYAWPRAPSAVFLKLGPSL
jgi:hypothetical protein